MQRQRKISNFHNFEFCVFQHVGSREGVAQKIDTDTRQKIDEMNRALSSQKEPVIKNVLDFIYDIKPELHKNYKNNKA